MQAWAKTVGPSPSMFVEPHAGAGLGHDRRERGLADLKRVAPKVTAVQLDQVEGVEEDALVSALVTDEIERSNAVLVAGDSFAVDDTGALAMIFKLPEAAERSWRRSTGTTSCRKSSSG